MSRDYLLYASENGIVSPFTVHRFKQKQERIGTSVLKSFDLVLHFNTIYTNFLILSFFSVPRSCFVTTVILYACALVCLFFVIDQQRESVLSDQAATFIVQYLTIKKNDSLARHYYNIYLTVRTRNVYRLNC